jgi:4-amino-4-deoxy-L-arabinose transferase-like glycosyltransferase
VSVQARLRAVPVEAVLVGLGLLVLLATFVSADPTAGLTFSIGPFTDEAFNTVNARNLVLLGQWSSDEWNLHLVNLPFSLLMALLFKVVGVGMIQARLAMIVCVSLTAVALAWGLRGVLGRLCATFAAVAFGCAGLILFYGRLAFLEDLVVLCLTLGTLVLARDERLTLRGGIVAGLCYAVAAGVKPSALFSVAGIMVALALVYGRHNPDMRRWLAGATGVLGLAGLAWVVAIWLPNRAAVAIDFDIWPPYQFYLSPPDIASSVAHFVGKSDMLFGVMLGPLLGLAALGALATALLRRRLSRVEARMAVAALGWLVFGLGILLLVSYRPNRYAVAFVPPLAILAATGLHLGIGWLRDHAGRSARVAVSLLAVVAIGAATAPGLVKYTSWMRAASYELPGIQDRFADLVPEGQRVAGRDVALFLMRSKATTVVTGLANNGDLYGQGVRWYLVERGADPPEGVPASAWEARWEVACGQYGGETECLYHVP